MEGAQFCIARPRKITWYKLGYDHVQRILSNTGMTDFESVCWLQDGYELCGRSLAATLKIWICVREKLAFCVAVKYE